MTAHAVGPTPVASPASRNAPASSAPEPAGSGHFDHQLHAARQHHAPRDADHSPMGPNAREPGAKPHPLNNHRAEASPPTDSQDPPTSASATTSPSAPTAPTAASAQLAGSAQPTAPAAKAPTDTGDGDDEAASALAGAMLALIGPSVAGVLRPAAAAARAVDVLAQAGKTVATDASAAMLLQLGDPASATAATGNPTPAAMAGMLTAADGLLPIATVSKDPSLADTTPTTTLPAPATAAAPTAPPVLQLPSPVGSQAFAQDLGQQVAWLGGQGIKQARIRLHPEELGSLDVKVSVTHGRVDVVFSAQHPAAVAAVQQSLPQLDHMLAQHGLSLGHAEVGQRDRGDRHGHAGDAGTALDEPGEIHAIGMTTSLGQVGLLDAFA
jgi:flagellar hook-length control protein FliK